MKKNLQLIALLISNIGYADTFTGKVVSVIDGDTITVLGPSYQLKKVRFAGIDAPEKSQDFGNVAKRTLSDLIYNKTVTVEFHKMDPYNRIIGKVTLDGQDINNEQLKQGMAWFYRKYQNELPPSDRDIYADSENHARHGKLGLWADSEPMPPWEFRHK